MDSIEALNAKADRMAPSEDVNWNVVRLIVEKYTERHPEEVVGCVDLVKRMRIAAKDAKFADTGSEANRRHVMELPSALSAAIEWKYPKALSGKNLRIFKGMYPVFFIPEKL